MKMIVVVLIVKAIISMVEKNKNVANKNESRNKIIHPAEFEVR